MNLFEQMGNKKSCVFIGSSTEGLKIAKTLQLLLDHSCEVTIWSQGVFGLNQGNLESLVNQLNKFDFAILILTPDDLVTSRESTGSAPRDNILFELGLFMGGLGKNRTFIVYDRSKPIKLPSDLAGVTAATFEVHSSGNLQSSLGATSTLIEAAIEEIGPKKQQVQPSVSKYFLKEYPDISSHLEDAVSIKVIGLNLSSAAHGYYSKIKNALERGVEVRFVACSPKRHLIEQLVLRSFELKNNIHSKNNVEWEDMNTRKCLELVLSLSNLSEKCELRVIDFVSPYGLILIEERNGTSIAIVKIMGFRVSKRDYTVFTLEKSKERNWHDYFVNQFSEFWDASLPVQSIDDLNEMC